MYILFLFEHLVFGVHANKIYFPWQEFYISGLHWFKYTTMNVFKFFPFSSLGYVYASLIILITFMKDTTEFSQFWCSNIETELKYLELSKGENRCHLLIPLCCNNTLYGDTKGKQTCPLSCHKLQLWQRCYQFVPLFSSRHPFTLWQKSANSPELHILCSHPGLVLWGSNGPNPAYLRNSVQDWAAEALGVLAQLSPLTDFPCLPRCTPEIPERHL